jgi:hypothetical protein
VSEGCGLGGEMLRGWLTEEREESSGAGQIPTDDGAQVLGRATGNVGSGRWRSAPVARAWMRGEWGKMGMGRRPTLLKSGSMAQGREEKRGGRRGRVCMEVEEGGEGGGCLARQSVACGGQHRPPTVGRGWRRCRANRGGWMAWVMRAMGWARLTGGTGVRRGPVAAAGV